MTTSSDQVASILADRTPKYGAFIDNATISQSVKDIFHQSPNWTKLRADQQEALDMMCIKLGRILSGDPNHKDSWQDLAGYPLLTFSSGGKE